MTPEDLAKVRPLELTLACELLLLEAKQVAARARKRMGLLRHRFPADDAIKATSPRSRRPDDNPDQPHNNPDQPP
jgi:hypothetical protein